MEIYALRTDLILDKLFTPVPLAPAIVSSAIQDLMQQAGTAIREVQKDLEIACKIVQKLNVNLAAEGSALSALKIPKSLDDPATFERLRREIALSADFTVWHVTLSQDCI